MATTTLFSGPWSRTAGCPPTLPPAGPGLVRSSLGPTPSGLVTRRTAEHRGVLVACGARGEWIRGPDAAVLLVGPGSRITHAAITLLADSATCVCWVGEHGVRLYASGIGAARGSQLQLRQAWLVTRPKERVAVARRMYDMRFPGEDTSALTLQQLRGREGTRVRKLYAHHSQRTGVTWTKRDYKPGDAFAWR